jgi:K(+)-stimulated pyrophosphate-energized sodium pump
MAHFGFWVAMLVSLGSLVTVVMLAKYVLSQDTGTERMREISDAIRQGAEAFLRRQYRTITTISLIVGAILLFFYLKTKLEIPEGMTQKQLAWKIVVAFFLGAFCSGIAGYVGMYISIRSNIRAASAARTDLNRALQIALRGGAVSGLLVVAMSLLGVGLLFFIYGGLSGPFDVTNYQKYVVPLQIVGFGFGASFVALFAQLGGGIYTKAADVGADLVGKVEAGIPEDDPRNPAVIADLVGDNVGDCAGRGADLFESTAAENIGAMILGMALIPIFGAKGIIFPLLARAFGLIASIVGVYSVRVKEDEDPMHALNRGYGITTVLAILGFLVAVLLLLRGNMWFFLAGVVGIATSYLYVWITQYYTEYRYRPVLSIADACKTGPATTIISGLSVALECTAAPVIVISAAIMLSYWLGKMGMMQYASEFAPLPNGGLYGTAVATMGMLATCGYILAMDTFGPITDNAGGIVEMSDQPKEVRDRTDRLDSVGNTTKALTKGYAVGSAALAAFLLFSAYLDEVVKYAPGFSKRVDIGRVPVFIGGLLGAMLIFLFSAMAIRAVGKTAQKVIEAVREQFAQHPGIMQGTEKPDYGRCVDIVTRGALRAMILPGILPLLFVGAVGFTFKSKIISLVPGTGAEAVAALLMIGTIAGILMALVMNNGGGAWDNAKKYIETGQLGGKGSPAHKAAVVGDTVGDPLKDTAGPSLHVLIKLLSTITLVLAPLFL